MEFRLSKRCKSPCWGSHKLAYALVILEKPPENRDHVENRDHAGVQWFGLKPLPQLPSPQTLINYLAVYCSPQPWCMQPSALASLRRTGGTGLNAECINQMLMWEFLFLTPLMHLGQNWRFWNWSYFGHLRSSSVLHKSHLGIQYSLESPQIGDLPAKYSR